MRPIEREEIVEVWNDICDLGEQGSAALVKKFMDEQPALGIYLAASGEVLEGGAQESHVVELTVACWQVMTKAADRRLKSISPKALDRAEAANTKALERLEDASEIEWQQTVRESFEGYNQQEMLGFGIEILMSGHEEAPELAPESIGLEMLWLKTILDCLDQA